MVSVTLKEGDTIWVVDRWRKGPGHAEAIAKIGRIYLFTTSGRKVNRGTLEDGFALDENHYYFPNEAAHRRYLQTIRAQVDLMDRLKRTNLTLEQTQAINALLGWTA